VLIFTVRRFAQAVLVLIGSTFLMYIAVFQLGDPFLTKPGSEKVVSPEARALLHAHFGLDKPFYLQYLIYLKNIFTLDFGIDFDQRRQVSELLGAAAPNTVRLAVLAIALNVLFGVLAGIAAAVWKDTFIDALVTVSTVMLLCVPSFVLGLILRAKLSGLHVFGSELFPQLPHPFGVEPPWFKAVLLPAFTLGALEIAFVSRLVRASMLEVMHETYLHTARAKGLPERIVIFKHAARNALLPVVTHVGIAFGALLGGAVITETIFSYPGLGYLFIRSVANVNNPVMLAIAVLAVITFVTLSAVVDVLSAYLDPRIRVS
jgi:ABC-type dipeptide/oligopeptide/nickel transport system permease component